MKHFSKLTLIFVPLALASAAFAQTPPSPDRADDGPAHGPAHGPRRAPRPGEGLRLLQNPKVVAELRLSETQLEQIKALGAPPVDPRGPRPEADRPKQEEAPRQGDRANAAPPQPPKDGPEERLKAILTPEQFARFGEIRLQREGTRALGRPDVAKALELTDAQRESLRPTPPGEGGRPDPKAEEARRLELLTDAQRAKWREMLGRPLDLGPDRPDEERGPDAP